MSIERFSLDGKVAVITGGAGGCGEEYGRGLTAAGAKVVLADLDGDKAERVAAELREQGRDAIGVQVDITDPDAAAAMAQAAIDAFGGIDILINNAALMKEIPMGSILTLPLDWWDRVMKVNVMGALVCTPRWSRRCSSAVGAASSIRCRAARSSRVGSTASASSRS